jgi:dipeptidyl aminopeptidase/acylaminoacyl peptidase
MLRITPFVLLFIVGCPPTLMSQERRLTSELLWQLGRVALEDVSPDGNQLLFAVQRYELSANTSSRVIYRYDLSQDRYWTISPAGRLATDAAFRPGSSEIGYLLDGQLRIVEPDGSNDRLLLEAPVNGYRFAPDGKSVLLSRDVRHDRSTADLNPDLPKTSGRLIDGLFYRHWKSWHDYQYSNLFLYSLPENQSVGEAREVMREPYDSPLQPFGGMEQVAWSPDGKWIVYTCRKLSGTAAAQSTNSDLYAFEVESGRVINFTADLPGYDLDPIFSPDGNYLAWTSMEAGGYESDKTRLMMLDLRTNLRSDLTENWDYEANHPQWSADSKSIFFLSSTDFTYQVHEIRLSTREIRKMTDGQHDYTSLKVAGSQLFTTRVAMDQPAEIYHINAVNGQVRQLTRETDPLWKSVQKGKVERRTLTTSDGKAMNAWVVFPPGFDAKKSYPALVLCQGGPQSALSQGFSYRWNLQLMAANDYVVIAPCRRGMPGAGKAWNDAIQGDWGGQPMQDLLTAADYIAAEPGINPRRIVAAGASFGGFSVYWLAGNHKNRFNAFIAHCGIFNLESFFTETEELWFANHDLEGAYWQTPRPRAYEASPHLFVKNWDKPLLIIHNELDFRIPVTQGMQAFQAAQLRGIPSQLLYFPDEGHWMSKPQNSVLWQRTFFGFLEKWNTP